MKKGLLRGLFFIRTSLGGGGCFGRFAIKAEKGEAACEPLLTAQTTGLVQTAFDAGHGFTHLAHARKGRTIFPAREAQPRGVHSGFSGFRRHGVSLLCSSRVQDTLAL
jgi:hypothetical protein